MRWKCQLRVKRQRKIEQKNCVRLCGCVSVRGGKQPMPWALCSWNSNICNCFKRSIFMEKIWRKGVKTEIRSDECIRLVLIFSLFHQLICIHNSHSFKFPLKSCPDCELLLMLTVSMQYSDTHCVYHFKFQKFLNS